MPELSSSLPADPLSLTVHSTPDPAVQQRTRAGRLRMLLVLLVCAAPVVASYLTYYVIRPQGRSNYGSLIDPQRPLPSAAALPLQDLQGRAVDPASLRRQWLLVVVAGGDCDARCEQLLYAQRQLREMLGKDKDRLDRVWLVDDAQAVREAVRPALANATVLRAPREALAQWLQPEPGQALEAHLYLVDPLGNWMMRFPAQGEPAKIKRDLERLMRASASWDEAGR
jgi:cytochrome oxidase Cu insertion factor (SCO1/SenC/PrrC family)